MKILFTGKDDFTYNRTRILLTGLLANSEVEVTQYSMKDPQYAKDELRQLASESDFVYVPAFRHSDVKPIKQLTDTPIVFDPLISKYLTRTIDYGEWWSAPKQYYRDWVAFKHSDIIMMDTQGDIDWIVQKYELDARNVFFLPIGANTSTFKPKEMPPNEKFVVGYHGGFIPLQGLDKIVEAARIVASERDILFDLLGAGPQFKKTTRLASKYGLTNINFRGWVKYEELSDAVNAFDLCLGIFGKSIKTELVVPNKVYEYAALGKCVISKETAGIQEVFTADKDIKLTPADPEKIAEAIVELKGDEQKREALGQGAYELITQKYNEHKIAERFIENLRQWQRQSA